MKARLAKIAAVLVFVFSKLKRVLPEVVQEVERAVRDNRISKKERKQIAMVTIKAIAEEFGVNFNFIVRMITSKLVDKAATKLPQGTIEVPKLVHKVCRELKREVNK